MSHLAKSHLGVMIMLEQYPVQVFGDIGFYLIKCENLCLSADDEYNDLSGISRLTILGYDPSVLSTADVPSPMTSLSIPTVGSESFIIL